MTSPHVYKIPDGATSMALVEFGLPDEKLDGKKLSADAVALLVAAAKGATTPALADIVQSAISLHPMSAKDETAICKALAEASGRRLADIKSEVKESRKAAKKERTAERIDAGVITGDMKHSQIALILARVLVDVCRWDDLTKRWYLKSGNIWKPVSPGLVLRRIKSVLDKSMQDDGYNASVLSGVESLLRIDLQVEGWEESRHLLPMENGILNLKTKVLEPYGSRAFVWQLPYGHDPAATCLTVDEYLESATGGDKALENLLVAWMWLVLHGRSDLQKYLEMVGHGGTGKSTFLALCKLLVGARNIVVTSLKTLEKNQFETANLKDKRLVQVTDSSRFGEEVSMLKAITGEDPLRYERKGLQAEDSFIFRGLVMVATNESIQSSDYTSGLSRRKIPVMMNAVVTEGQKAKYRDQGGILAVMQAEMPGLVNKLLALDELWVMDIINNPAGEVLRQKIEVELKVNPILGWLDECVVQCQEWQEEDFIGSLSTKEKTFDPKFYMYQNYVEWCQGQGRESMAIQRFTGLVVDNCITWGIKTKKHEGKRLKAWPGKQGTILAGLRLRTDADSNIGGMISSYAKRCEEAKPKCEEVSGKCEECHFVKSFKNHIDINLCEGCEECEECEEVHTRAHGENIKSTGAQAWL